MHEVSTDRLDPSPTDLLDAARESWDAAVELGEVYGVRNAQASVLAPTGTISFLMDCDTTGVEPDLGLVKTKKLVGGGTMSIVNQTIPRALRRLGYSEEENAEIVAYIDEHRLDRRRAARQGGAPPGVRLLDGRQRHPLLGHVKMLGAAQPFISGGISKTVNMPDDVTVEDVEQLHIDAWKIGLKAVAIYRDNSKVGQPLSTSTKAQAAQEPSVAAPSRRARTSSSHASRSSRVRSRRHVTPLPRPRGPACPRRRRSNTFSFRVADCEGYVTVGEYEDGRPGEVFMKVSKQGSTLSGVMDAFAIAVSLGLQHGVPLVDLCPQVHEHALRAGGDH